MHGSPESTFTPSSVRPEPCASAGFHSRHSRYAPSPPSGLNIGEIFIEPSTKTIWAQLPHSFCECDRNPAPPTDRPRVPADTQRLRSATTLPFGSALTPVLPSQRPWPFPCSSFVRKRSYHREPNRPRPLPRAHHPARLAPASGSANASPCATLASRSPATPCVSVPPPFLNPRHPTAAPSFPRRRLPRAQPAFAGITIRARGPEQLIGLWRSIKGAAVERLASRCCASRRFLCGSCLRMIGDAPFSTLISLANPPSTPQYCVAEPASSSNPARTRWRPMHFP